MVCRGKDLVPVGPTRCPDGVLKGKYRYTIGKAIKATECNLLISFFGDISTLEILIIHLYKDIFIYHLYRKSR